MNRERPKHRRGTLRVPIPRSRDPFVNTPLIPLGSDRRGVERFWTSTWNDNVGCLAVVVDETGTCRRYTFDTRCPGFYSAVQQDEKTLWLCGGLDRVVRLDLATGKYRPFETGAPEALVFQGMALDPGTRKLFALAYPPGGTTAFSFDIAGRRTARVYPDLTPEHYMRFSFPNGDGTWSFVVQCPGLSLVRWDPRRETVETTVLAGQVDIHEEGVLTTRLVGDDAGRYYFPGRGWYDPRRRRFERRGPRPQEERCWFTRRGGLVWGVKTEGGGAHVGVWDLSTGQVRDLCTVPDAYVGNINVTRSGKVISVNTYGVFHLFDAETGALEISRTLPTDAVGRVDCLCRIDEDRLLGTPFITQRFWEANVRTGKGLDCGRAAPGAGEILLTWKTGRRVYMAAYTGGELVEYDPDVHPHFPENPHVVADPPHGMRPVAGATDGRHIFYATSAPYGTLGSTLTRYDTRTGRATYAVNPLPDQQIHSLRYDRRTGTLICGTTLEADCASCPPKAEVCCVARIDARDLSVLLRRPAPGGFSYAGVLGPLGHDTWLCHLGTGYWLDSGTRWFALDGKTMRIPSKEMLRRFPDGCRQIVYAGRTGTFVLLLADGRVELWDMRKCLRRRLLARRRGVQRVVVQDASVYLVRQRDIVILEHCLRSLSPRERGRSQVRGKT